MLETLSEHNYCHKYYHSILVYVKNRGGLIRSSINVIKIVKFTENTLKQLTSGFNSLTIPGLSTKIIIAVKNYVYRFNIFKDLNCLNEFFRKPQIKFSHLDFKTIFKNSFTSFG